jgi:hypothetical protein
MSRFNQLITIAQKLGACTPAIEAARTRPIREIISAYGHWIVKNLRLYLSRQELWLIVQFNPLAAVTEGWDTLTQDMRNWAIDQHPETVLKHAPQLSADECRRCVAKVPFWDLCDSIPFLSDDRLAMVVRTRTGRKLVREHGHDIMRRLRHRLNRSELWRFIKINPTAAVSEGWGVLTEEMKDWVVVQHPEIILRNSPQIDDDRVRRSIVRCPIGALHGVIQSLPNDHLAMVVQLRPDAALDMAGRYLTPDDIWSCIQRSSRLRQRQLQLPPEHTYYIIHVRRAWYVIRAKSDPLYLPAPTAREARQMAISIARSWPSARIRIFQFAAGDRPRYTEILSG